MEETLNQVELQPINLDKAELIISSSAKKNGAFKAMMYLLREVEEQIYTRQKRNKLFYQIVNTVEMKYTRQIYTNKQLIDSINSELQYINQDMDNLSIQRTSLKEELEVHEEELNGIRDYAEQRRNKKSKRERQYHQLYNIPIVNNQFKKKYVRARDKNSDAEEKVSEVRSTVDSCQRAIAEISKSLVDCQSKKEQLIAQQQDTEKQVNQVKDLVFNLQEGTKFWHGFDQCQLDTAAKATTQFIETIQKHAKNHNTFHKIMDPNNDFVKILKMALYEYGEAERYAESRWGQLQVDFNCAKCKTSQFGWPMVDKVRVHDLLCEPCYKENRTAMIWEKKMKMGMDRSQQLLSLPGGSTLSFASSSSSIATTNTNSSSSSGKKPGFKKMMQMFKNGNKRRSSSSTSFGLESSERSQMMRAS
jgi:predicted  nucleic acid-binding Zn-ribbon protein